MTPFCLLFLVLSLFMKLTNGRPFMLLSSRRQICQSLVAPREQTVTIHYESPDLNSETDEKSDEEESTKSRSNHVVDKITNRSSSDRDITISIVQHGGSPSQSLSSRQRKTWSRTTGVGRIKEEIYQTKGSIDFLTGDTDGPVEICVYSLKASTKSPKRFSIHVEIEQSKDELAKEAEEYGIKNNVQEVDADGNLSADTVKLQMTRLERDLETMKNRVRSILSNAEYNKEQEIAFHEQSLQMNRATRYWPIIQLVVLCITGFTQANHIVKYLKSHVL